MTSGEGTFMSKLSTFPMNCGKRPTNLDSFTKVLFLLVPFYMRNLVVFCFLFLFAVPLAGAQPTCRIDSLQGLLSSAKDTQRVNILNALSINYRMSGQNKKAMDCSQLALDQAKKLGFSKGISRAYTNMAASFTATSTYSSALENHQEALRIDQELGDQKSMSTSLINIAGDYQGLGDYDKAMDSFLRAMEICRKTGDKQGIVNCDNGIGHIYFRQGNLEKALDRYTQGMQMAEEVQNKDIVGGSYVNMGNVLSKMGEYDKALNYHVKALKVFENIGQRRGIAVTYNNIGNIYGRQGNYTKAREIYGNALRMYEDLSDRQGVGITNLNIGCAYMEEKRFKDSETCLKRAMGIFNEKSYKEGLREVYSSLADLYGREAKYKEALEYHRLYSSMKDTLFNAENSRSMVRMQSLYETQRKEKEIELLKKDKDIKALQLAQNESEASTQRTTNITSVIVIGLLLVLAFLFYSRYQVKQKSNLSLSKAYLQLEQKNKQITDSITYARRIQEAILPPDEIVKKLLPDSFILYRPRDIVSGDFYWLEKNGEKIIIAVADCTGHGVPGAFMSMIGNTLLNEIVNEKHILDPAAILNELNAGVAAALHQKQGSALVQDDGMDISLCVIDMERGEVAFAGAGQPLFFVNGNGPERIPGDSSSIGGTFGKKAASFTSKNFQLKNASVYLYTDGYADQFGGDNDEKFTSKRFENLLHSLSGQRMDEQRMAIEREFEAWKGERKQVDDVCVIGIKI